MVCGRRALLLQQLRFFSDEQSFCLAVLEDLSQSFGGVWYGKVPTIFVHRHFFFVSVLSSVLAPLVFMIPVALVIFLEATSC